MDNLNLNKAKKAQVNELQDAHDYLINAASKETSEEDEDAGFMKKYSDKVGEQSVIK